MNTVVWVNNPAVRLPDQDKHSKVSGGTLAPVLARHAPPPARPTPYAHRPHGIRVVTEDWRS
jgi:hypothetical protein